MIWLGATWRNGYGVIYVQQKQIGAHVLMWKVFHECEVPDGLVICHTCDNPPCIEPNHLVAATQSANILDAVDKGRVIPYGRNRP